MAQEPAPLQGPPSAQQLDSQGAKIAVWGVGAQLALAFDQPALGGS